MSGLRDVIVRRSGECACEIKALVCVFFFQAEDGIRDAQESRGLGDVYKRQSRICPPQPASITRAVRLRTGPKYSSFWPMVPPSNCLLYTSDAADDLLCVDLGGRRIINKKTNYSRLSVTSTPSNTNYQAQPPTTSYLIRTS